MGGFSAGGLYGDGMNLYAFAGANPVNRRDPSALFWGMVGAMATYAGEGLIVAGQASQALGAAFTVVGAANYLDGATLWATMAMFDDWNVTVMQYARAAMKKGTEEMATGALLMGGGWALKFMGATMKAAGAYMLLAGGGGGGYGCSDRPCLRERCWLFRQLDSNEL